MPVISNVDDEQCENEEENGRVMAELSLEILGQVLNTVTNVVPKIISNFKKM